MKAILIFVILIFSSVIYADIEQRRNELISVLDEELREVVRLNKQTGNSRAHLILRMGQILLEKARLLKDRENQKFLETPQDLRNRINSDEHYKESRKYFDQAQKTVLMLLKRFPKFEDRGDAYYILAYNAKELKQEEDSKRFFQKAIDESRRDSLTSEKSRIALAEMYFNRGSFDKALTLYEVALKGKKDKWWTKDAFNMSWCYFKLGKFDRAIDVMTEAYELSKNKAYIDMSRSIERDIAFFYTEAGRSNEAVLFYKKNGKNVSEVLLKVGRFLKNQGKYAAAEKALVDALSLKQSEKEELEINVELLSLYEKFGRYDKHLEACKSLAIQFDKGSLNGDQIEVLTYNVQKLGALLQQQVVDKTFDHQPAVRDGKVKAAVEYFTISAKLNSKKSQMPLFHAGETFFAVGDYDKAVPFYSEAIKQAKINGDKKTEELAGNALMVSLGKGVKKDTSEKFLIPAYDAYLSANPKGEKANLIYQRLFSHQMSAGDIKAAESTLNAYRSNFSNETETQEKMIAQVMDFYKSKSDNTNLLAWAKKIESGEARVSPEYGKKVKELTLGLQFAKVEEANVKGDKKSAIKGYFQIYKSKESSDEAKRMAAYNIAVLFYESGDAKQMYAWADKAMTMMNAPEVNKFEKDFIIFSTDLFQRRQFFESANLSEKALEKLCLTDSKSKKIYFKNANIVYLTEKQFEKSRSVIQKGTSCKIAPEIIHSAYLDHLSELASSNKWNAFVEILSFLESSKEIHPFLIYPASLLASEFENIGKADEARKYRQKMMSFYESSKKQKMDIPLEGLDAVALYKINAFENSVTSFKGIKLKFPEKDFNALLKQKFSRLEKLAAEAEDVSAIGSGIGVLKVYRHLIDSYTHLKEEVAGFTPPGKSEEYLNSFKKSMQALVVPLEKQAREFKEVALKKIEKENILSKDNYWFLSDAKKNSLYEFFNADGGALMDKAGSK